MTKNVNHIQHIKSNVVVEGKPKLPQSSALVEGELAINYAENVETISLKNSNDDIVTFSSDNYYTKQKLGSGFTGENSATTVTEALENLQVGEEVEVTSGDTPTGDTIEIWIDESVDPLTVDAYTKAEVNALVDEKQDIIDDQAPIGNGVGVCSTSAETLEKEVVLADYVLVKNGFVSVTFENDVPSGSTLNVNNQGAKPIYHKNAPIEDDVISSGDTVLFGYDGTHYVVSSLGGGSTVNPNETVNISLTQVGGSSADLIGASITITDDDTSETLLTTTWNGSTITTEIDVNTNYTVSVETIASYLDCAPQSYQAGYQTERNITFQYRALGVFIEATDGTLYTSSTWAGSEKTANSVVVINGSHDIRVALTESQLPFHSNYSDPLENYITANDNGTAVKADYDGVSNTAKIINFNRAYNTNTSNYAAPYCNNFIFPDGKTKGHLMSCGEANIIFQNITEITNCLSSCGGTSFKLSGNALYWASNFHSIIGNYRLEWYIIFGNGTFSRYDIDQSYFVRPISLYD